MTQLKPGDLYGLRGKVVTVNGSFDLVDPGVVFVNAGGGIEDVRRVEEGAPDGFENAPVINTQGTIYPGLIELHNQLSYNALPMWKVPHVFTDRNVWPNDPDYAKRVNGVMCVLGQTDSYPEAVVRYVECKCLMGGVTTTQGPYLSTRSGILTFYKGLVRNVEATGDDSLPSAFTHIGDVSKGQAAAFLQEQSDHAGSRLFLHLSEGTDAPTRKHFLDLHIAVTDEWAITNTLVGIHCTALEAEDFQVLAEHGASMVWSPLSNLLLYGQTADVKKAKELGVPIGLGSDWSPSGSKNLLGELKVARIVSDQLGGVFSNEELVAMVTRTAAHILGWGDRLGSVVAGGRADFLVLKGVAADPYEQLIRALETDIALVCIDGVPRYGQKGLMSRFEGALENVTVGGRKRVLNLGDEHANEIVGKLTLRAARTRLKDGLHRIKELSQRLDSLPREMDEQEGPGWTLVLDQQFPVSSSSGLVLSSEKEDLELAQGLLSPRARKQCPTDQLESIELDPITVADDYDGFFNELRGQTVLPGFVSEQLPSLYGR